MYGRKSLLPVQGAEVDLIPRTFSKSHRRSGFHLLREDNNSVGIDYLFCKVNKRFFFTLAFDIGVLFP